MVPIKTFRSLALSLPGTTEAPHFDKAAFKVKKIFATLDEAAGLAHIRLRPADQASFCAYDTAIIYPVSNKWGAHGWTTIRLSAVRKPMLLDALTSAYIAVASKELIAQLTGPAAAIAAAGH